jgi:hypothetical protein
MVDGKLCVFFVPDGVIIKYILYNKVIKYKLESLKIIQKEIISSIKKDVFLFAFCFTPFYCQTKSS